MFASLFVLLYLAHLIADYPLQTDHQAAHKAEKTTTGWRACLTHAATHVIVSAVTLTTGIAVLGLPITVPVALGALAWIGFTHAAIDRRRGITAWMRLARQTQFAAHGGTAHVDQTAHLTALAVAALVITATS